VVKTVTVPEIARRMEEYAGSEIRFNLLALVRDRRCVLGETMRRATTGTRLEVRRVVHAVVESMEEGALAGSPNPEAVVASFKLAASVPEFNAAGSGSAAASASAGLPASSTDHFEPADTVEGRRLSDSEPSTQRVPLCANKRIATIT